MAISAAQLVEVRKEAEPRGRPRDEGPRMRMKGARVGVLFPLGLVSRAMRLRLRRLRSDGLSR